MKIHSRTMLFFGFALFVAAMLQLTAMSLTAAQGKQPEIAVVDLEELQEKYEAFKEQDAEFRRFTDERVKRLQIRELLTPEEWTELDALEQKKEKDLKAEEKKRLEELRALTEQRKARGRVLQSTTNPSDKDKEELKKLTEIPNTNRIRMAEASDKIQKEVMEEQKRLTERLRKQVTDVYEKVARDKGFSVVLDKGQVQWASPAADITQDVLKQLNRK